MNQNEYTIHYADIYTDIHDKFMCRVMTIDNEPATINNLRCASDMIYLSGRIVADDGRVLKNRRGDISPPL